MRLSILTCHQRVMRFVSARRDKLVRSEQSLGLARTHQLAGILRLLPRWLLRELCGQGVEQSPRGATQLVTRKGAHLPARREQTAPRRAGERQRGSDAPLHVCWTSTAVLFGDPLPPLLRPALETQHVATDAE
jgi:hypothetical protein